MRRSRYILIILFLLMACTGSGQEEDVVRDLRLWTGVKIEKEFASRWRLSLEEEIRFKQNISEINNFFTELELRYLIDRNFSLGAGYRYTRDRNDDASYDGFSRNYFALHYRRKLDFLTISYRLKYQREVEAGKMFERDAAYIKQFRNRLGVRMTRFNNIQPYVTGEVLQVFTPYLSPLNDYWRLVVGVRIEPGKIGEFKLGWGFNREIGVDQPFMIYMIRLNYTYSL